MHCGIHDGNVAVLLTSALAMYRQCCTPPFVDTVGTLVATMWMTSPEEFISQRVMVVAFMLFRSARFSYWYAEMAVCVLTFSLETHRCGYPGPQPSELIVVFNDVYPFWLRYKFSRRFRFTIIRVNSHNCRYS